MATTRPLPRRVASPAFMTTPAHPPRPWPAHSFCHVSGSMRKAALRPCESIARTLKPQTQRKTLTSTGERRCIEQTIPPITGDHLHIQLHWANEPRGWATPCGSNPAPGQTEHYAQGLVGE